MRVGDLNVSSERLVSETRFFPVALTHYLPASWKRLFSVKRCYLLHPLPLGVLDS